MRLMRLQEDGSFGITKNLTDNIPPYAILSHTWGDDEDEPTLQDITRGIGSHKAGFRKIRFCRDQAASDGIEHFWVDTCCIDKSSSAELSTAINSMFRWYRDAVKCYVYLSDVPKQEPRGSNSQWKEAFRKSRWFSRGWTLQELLAPCSVEFFSLDWQRLGDKKSLANELQEITGISIRALRGQQLWDISEVERMSWLGSRQTKLPEDMAYCALGIFDVQIPLLYGEGKQKAFFRLREAIEKQSSFQQDLVTLSRTFPELNVAPHALTSTTIQPRRYIPFPRNKRFVGRAAVLNTLKEKLFTQTECQSMALVGLGGIGKTQTALQLAYWVKEEKPEYSIFWIPAVGNSTFEQSYAEMAMQLGIRQNTDNADIKDMVRQQLSSDRAGKWFLIVDNADSMDVLFGSDDKPGIYEYLPESENGRTLFTTRSTDVAISVAGHDILDLQEMSHQEATDFLEKSLIQKSLLKDEVTTTELLQNLTYLPLAIAQAAAYLNRNRMSFQKYLGLLQGTEKDMVSLMSREFQDNTRYKGSQNAVITTWLVSFDQIREADGITADLLSFISCIEPKAIPQSILPLLESQEQMEYAIGTLCGYAFLTRRGESELFDMHSLVHVATRVWVRKHDLLQQAVMNAIKHLSEIIPLEAFKDRDKRRAYLPHALQVLNISDILDMEKKKYQLYMDVGYCLNAERQFKHAINCYKKVYEWGKEFLSEDNHGQLNSELCLAKAYLEDRQIAPAINILEHLVAVRRMQAEDDPFRLAAEHYLANSYLLDRRMKEATELFEHIVAVERTILAEDDDYRLTAEHSLANVYREDGRLKQSIEILEQVVNVRRSTLPEDDYLRLSSEHALASAYLADRRIDQAIEMLEHILSVWKMTLAEDDHLQLSVKHTLARAYTHEGRIKQAIEILEHVVAIEKTMLAEDNHSRLASVHALANAYVKDGRIKQAIEMFERVLVIWETALMEDDQFRLAAEHDLARAYHKDGRTKEAIKLLEHVLAVEKATLAEDDRSRLVSERTLAMIYLDGENVDEGIKLLELVVAVQTRTFAEDDPDRLQSEHLLEAAYARLNSGHGD